MVCGTDFLRVLLRYVSRSAKIYSTKQAKNTEKLDEISASSSIQYVKRNLQRNCKCLIGCYSCLAVYLLIISSLTISLKINCIHDLIVIMKSSLPQTSSNLTVFCACFKQQIILHTEKFEIILHTSPVQYIQCIIVLAFRNKTTKLASECRTL